MASVIVYALLFLLPFIVYPIGTNPYEPIKVLVAELLIGCLAFVYFLQMKKSEKPNRLFVGLLLAIAAVSLLHAIFQRTPITLFGNSFRMHGVFLLWMVLLFAFITSHYKTKTLPWYVFPLVIASHLAAGVVMQLTLSGRAVGTVGEPNAFAAVIVFLWPFLWFVKEKKRWVLPIQIIFSGLALLIILFTGSRSGIVAYVIQVLFLLTVWKVHQAIGKIVIGCLLLYLCSLALPFVGPQTEYENRGEIWQTAVIAGYDNPVFGSGFGNTENAIKEHNHRLYNRLRGYYVDSSHNIFLDWWVQGGFIGLSLLVGIFYFAFRSFTKRKKVLELTLLFGLLVVFSFNPLSVASLVSLWWLFGQAASET